ncbi:MAG TPA: hypothetical protein VK078_10090 [Pseudogracilibacillus sp.]|nr:hypothetical protein [Pseudogracilibacillus sp.]
MLQQQIYLTREWIEKYAEVIGAPLMKYEGRMMAPSTMIVIFWKVFDAAPISEKDEWIHVKQNCCYEYPLVEEMILDCQLEKVTERNIKQITYSEFQLNCFHEGKLLATSTTTLMKDDSNEKV